MGYDSVDVWANQGEFQLDENLTPIKVAGVPPDAFSDAGQKWGNPLYDYEKMEANDFSWWRKRMKASARLYDVIRIDRANTDRDRDRSFLMQSMNQSVIRRLLLRT